MLKAMFTRLTEVVDEASVKAANTEAARRIVSAFSVVQDHLPDLDPEFSDVVTWDEDLLSTLRELAKPAPPLDDESRSMLTMLGTALSLGDNVDWDSEGLDREDVDKLVVRARTLLAAKDQATKRKATGGDVKSLPGEVSVTCPDGTVRTSSSGNFNSIRWQATEHAKKEYGTTIDKDALNTVRETIKKAAAEAQESTISVDDEWGQTYTFAFVPTT